MSRRLSASAPWARTAWGIDDTPTGLIVVRVVRRFGRLHLEPARTDMPATLPADSAVVACLRQRESFIRGLEAPLASPHKALRVFPSLLDVQLPFPIEDCVFDILDARSATDGRSSRGLAAGARRTDIDKRLQFLETTGIQPHVLDQESLALWSQALAEYPADTATPRVTICENDDGLTLVVGRGDELLGAHAFRAFDADTVHRTLRLYFAEPPPALRWIWAGPAARNAAAVRDRHAILAARWPGPLDIATDPESFLARALAMRALTSGPLRFDARRDRHAHPAVAERDRRAPFKAAAICLVAGLALCAVNLAWMAASRHRLDGLQGDLRRLAIRVAGSERLVPREMERLGAQRSFDENAKLAAPLLAPFRPPVMAAVASVLEAARDEDLRVQTLSATRSLVTLYGTAQTWRQCERAVNKLEQKGWRVKAVRKSEATERVPLVITAEVPHE